MNCYSADFVVGQETFQLFRKTERTYLYAWVITSGTGRYAQVVETGFSNYASGPLMPRHRGPKYSLQVRNVLALNPSVHAKLLASAKRSCDSYKAGLVTVYQERAEAVAC